ncbi:MAG: transposase [Chitinophagaceae bacterium]|nr:transposase [Chitinophagaceae bacterium]
MQFIQGQPRQQTYFSTLEDQVAADNPVRLIDAFIDKVDLQQLGFKKTVQQTEGRPPYSPQVLLKLYLYGYLNKIRSSRKLKENAAEMLSCNGCCKTCNQTIIPLPTLESCIHSRCSHCFVCMFIF